MKTTEHSRIHWACRRGMLELDQLFEPFFLNEYASLTEEEQQQFIELLGCLDQDLYNWLLGEQEPEHESLKHICDKIRQAHLRA